ncbi:MAG: hypothetical protein L0228_09655 [Planctomycetes bacterium]|nr:hypothetical protein [Planctomycetota bacterium]
MLAQNTKDSIDSLPLDEIVRLECHVRRRLCGRLREFRVQIQGAGLILVGCVATYYAKQLAQHAVMEASSLPILANDIEVR